MKVEMVVVVGSRGNMYRGEMREYTYSYKSHKMSYHCYGCGLSVTEFCKKMSVTYRYIHVCIQVRLSSHTHICTTYMYVHVNNHISTCIIYIPHTSHINCGMAAQPFLSVTELQGEPGPVNYTYTSI